jgi:hypothetical protein
VVRIGGAWGQEKKLIAQVDKISDGMGGVKVKVRLVNP